MKIKLFTKMAPDAVNISTNGAPSNITASLPASPSFHFGIGIVLLFSLLYSITWLGLFFAIKPGIVPFIIATGALYISARYLSHSATYFQAGMLVFAAVIVLALLCLLAINIFDSSWDGIAYHQSATMAVANGWLPLFGAPLGSSLWENHYPKASWIVGATLAGLFHSVEAAKAQNPAFILAAACLSFSALKIYLPHLDFRLVLLLAITAAANPVALGQAMTGYNDGLAGSQLCCLVALSLIALRSHDKFAILGLCLLIPYTINLKFTSLIYAGMIETGLMVPLLLQKQKENLRIILAIAGALGVGIFIIGADPYISNTLSHGHPFYPLQGAGKVDIMGNNTPIGLLGQSYGYKLFAGLFSYSSSWNGETGMVIPAIPNLASFLAFSRPDIRIGGFGPLFGPAILLIVLALALSNKFDSTQWRIAALAGLIAISGLINPEAWWARYVPQLWLAIVLLGCAIIAGSAYNRSGNKLATAALALLFVNSLAITAVAGASFLSRDAYWRSSLTSLSLDSKAMPLTIFLGQHRALKVRLDAYGVQYHLAKNAEDCVNSSALLPAPRSYLSPALLCRTSDKP